MKYLIRIDSGESAGRSVELVGDILRIGSAPQADLRLASGPPQALTVFRRGDRIFLLNRSQKNVTVDRTQIERGTTSPWPVGTKTEFAGIALSLQAVKPVTAKNALSSHPKRERSVRYIANDGNDSNTGIGPDTESSPAQKQKRSQILVIVVCMCLVCAMQWLSRDSGAYRKQLLQHVAVLSGELRNVAESSNEPALVRQQSEELLKCISQFMISGSLDDHEMQDVARRETMRLCDSIIAQNLQLSAAEINRAKNVKMTISLL